MSLTVGARVGPYEVRSLLGSGGMGAVYRATDTKLNRDVALKILPSEFAADPDRLARFRREAQILASLNHPNIAAIHGVEESSDVRALVLELVEGPTLADRIAEGPIALAEAVAIARETAEALEAAHEQGIVHRDLKPANIKLRSDGTVKVLDFGLAKALEPASGAGAQTSAPPLMQSPTMTSPAMTQLGVILGTAPYMSPEQAKGRPADKRSDVWAFGCVFYEMLTAKRAFDGADVSDTLAAVLRADPDWNALPGSIPLAIVTLMRRCLERDPRRRIAGLSAIRFVLDEPGFSELPAHMSSAPAPRHWAARLAIPLLGAALLVSIAIAAARWTTGNDASTSRGVTRFPLALPAGDSFESNGLRVVGVSPDGTTIAYAAKSSDDAVTSRLYVRLMSEAAVKPLAGSEAAGELGDPVFSPDSGSLVYYSGSPAMGTYSRAKGVLKRIGVTGGTATTLCRVDMPLGMTWSGDSILFSQASKGILRVSAQGGEPELIIDLEDEVIAQRPQLLPDGDSVLFTLARAALSETDPFADSNPVEDTWDKADIVVESISTHERKTVIQGGSDAVFLPSGHLLYAVAGTLRAVAFDTNRREVTGRPVPVLEGVGRSRFGPRIRTGAAHVAVSQSGSLVYVAGPVTPSSSLRNLAVFRRTGEVESLKLTPANYEFARMSRDGTQFAVGVNDGTEANISVYDLRARQIRQLTSGGRNRYPVWSSNSRDIAFQSDREGDLAIWSQRADGTALPVRLTKADGGEAHIPDSWSEDLLLFEVSNDSGFVLSALSLRDRTVRPFGDVRSTSLPPAADVSPDGRWAAYQISAIGPGSRVAVQPIPPTGVSFPIATPGAVPRWSFNGDRLFYSVAGRIFAVSVSTQPAFKVGNPVLVGDTRIAGSASPGSRPGGSTVDRRAGFTVGPDDTFIGIIDEQPSATGAARSIEVVLNWTEELKQRVPTR